GKVDHAVGEAMEALRSRKAERPHTCGGGGNPFSRFKTRSPIIVGYPTYGSKHSSLQTLRTPNYGPFVHLTGPKCDIESAVGGAVFWRRAASRCVPKRMGVHRDAF